MGFWGGSEAVLGFWGGSVGFWGGSGIQGWFWIGFGVILWGFGSVLPNFEQFCGIRCQF